MAIEKTFPESTDVVYSGISFMQKWKAMLQEKDSKKVDEVTEALIKFLKVYKQADAVTDIVEI